MARYCSHTLILPDETRLDNMVVEVAGNVIAYYPFTGEVHSTIYIDAPILLSHRTDLEGKTISLTQLTWALGDKAHNNPLQAYQLTPCPTCMEGRFALVKL